MRLNVSILILALSSTGCSSSSGLSPTQASQAMSASFYDTEQKKFSLQAVGPEKTIREYAICKAVWFAKTKKASKVALSDPVYGGKLKKTDILNLKIPAGWIVVDAKAYVSEPKGTSNPFVDVREYAAKCREGWDWFR